MDAILIARRLALSNTEIAYWDQGDGPVLFLLHGMTGSKENWEPNIGSLSAHYRVIAPDWPGHGESDCPDLDYGIPLFTRALKEMMDRLGIGRAHLAGNSMGGHVSLAAALERPDATASICLIGSTGANIELTKDRLPYDPEALLQLGTFAPLPEETVHAMVKWVVRNWNEWSDKLVAQRLAAQHLPDAHQRFRAAMMSLLSILEANLADRLGEVRVPTLALWGDKDRQVRVSNAHFIEAHVPGARKIIFEACGHCPQLEYPERFNQALLDWLDSHPA